MSEGRARAHFASWGRRLMGARVCWGAFGVTLQIALGLMTRGFCAAGAQPRPTAERELRGSLVRFRRTLGAGANSGAQ